MTELVWRGTRVRVPDASVADYLARGFRRPAPNPETNAEPRPEPKARAKPKGR